MAPATSPDIDLDGSPEPWRLYLGRVVAARDLAGVLARQDFFVRYRRAAFGFVWAAALPLLQAAVLSFVLSRFARFDLDGLAYPLFVLCGTIVITFFNGVVTIGSTAIVDGSALTTKIYFPRIVLPIVTAVSSCYGLAINLVLLVIGIAAFRPPVSPRIVFLPVGVALLVLLASGIAAVLAAAHVYARDVRFLVQALAMVMFYATPVFYPLDVAGSARGLIIANPVTGVVELIRVGIGGASDDWLLAAVISVAWIVAAWVVAFVVHVRHDRLFVDLL